MLTLVPCRAAAAARRPARPGPAAPAAATPAGPAAAARGGGVKLCVTRRLTLSDDRSVRRRRSGSCASCRRGSAAGGSAAATATPAIDAGSTGSGCPANGRPGQRIDERRGERPEKSPRAHRLGRHRRVLIEQVAAAVAGVARGEVRASRAVVDARDLHRAAERDAEVLSRVRPLLRRGSGRS